MHIKTARALVTGLVLVACADDRGTPTESNMAGAGQTPANAGAPSTAGSSGPALQSAGAGASASGVRQLAGPTFPIAGETDMAVSPASIEAAFRAATVPAVYGLSLGHDHVMPVTMPAPILEAVTAWFRIHLADDAAARSRFYDPCTLCDDPTWQIETANL